MKNKFKIFRAGIGVLILTFMFSCSEGDPAASEQREIKFTSHQIPGCGNNLLSKTSALDSCFTYIFQDKLEINFCVPGNCCPDSNRFVANYKLNSDTLFISVSDTAENLCRCICNYIIHAEISGLQKNNYTFYCNYDDQIIYSEQVRK